MASNLLKLKCWNLLEAGIAEIEALSGGFHGSGCPDTVFRHLDTTTDAMLVPILFFYWTCTQQTQFVYVCVSLSLETEDIGGAYARGV